MPTIRALVRSSAFLRRSETQPEEKVAHRLIPWQRQTNVWRRVTSPARGSKRLTSIRLYAMQQGGKGRLDEALSNPRTHEDQNETSANRCKCSRAACFCLTRFGSIRHDWRTSYCVRYAQRR